MSSERMSAMEGLKSFGRYYVKLTKYIVRDTFLSFGKDQIAGIVLIILIAIYQVKYGLIRRDQTWANAMSIIKPYLWVLSAYVVIHAVRAPYVLDRARQREIENLKAEKAIQDQEIEKLDNQEAKKEARRRLRGEVAQLLKEGDRIWWNTQAQVPGSHREHTQWLKTVKDFLTQQPEFDSSYLTRFEVYQMQALKEFIQELGD